VTKKNADVDGSRPRKRPDGRWEARYWTETPTGRKRSSVYGATRKKCAHNLAEAIATKDKLPVIEATNITMCDFLARYEKVAEDT
jgi:hypothetical protein